MPHPKRAGGVEQRQLHQFSHTSDVARWQAPVPCMHCLMRPCSSLDGLTAKSCLDGQWNPQVVHHWAQIIRAYQVILEQQVLGTATMYFKYQHVPLENDQLLIKIALQFIADTCAPVMHSCRLPKGQCPAGVRPHLLHVTAVRLAGLIQALALDSTAHEVPPAVICDQW